jgi:hypothetical protein
MDSISRPDTGAARKNLICRPRARLSTGRRDRNAEAISVQFHRRLTGDPIRQVPSRRCRRATTTHQRTLPPEIICFPKCCCQCYGKHQYSST